MRKVEQKVKDAFGNLREHQERGTPYFKDFVKTCEEAHAEDVSDERISVLIGRAYSRSSIQQFRKGKKRKGMNCG